MFDGKNDKIGSQRDGPGLGQQHESLGGKTRYPQEDHRYCEQLDPVTAVHKTLADGRWFNFSLCTQLANIGSEVERAITGNCQAKGSPGRFLRIRK